MFSKDTELKQLVIIKIRRSSVLDSSDKGSGDVISGGISSLDYHRKDESGLQMEKGLQKENGSRSAKNQREF